MRWTVHIGVDLIFLFWLLLEFILIISKLHQNRENLTLLTVEAVSVASLLPELVLLLLTIWQFFLTSFINWIPLAFAALRSKNLVPSLTLKFKGSATFHFRFWFPKRIYILFPVENALFNSNMWPVLKSDPSLYTRITENKRDPHFMFDRRNIQNADQ